MCPVRGGGKTGPDIKPRAPIELAGPDAESRQRPLAYGADLRSATAVRLRQFQALARDLDLLL